MDVEDSDNLEAELEALLETDQGKARAGGHPLPLYCCITLPPPTFIKRFFSCDHMQVMN